MRHQRLAVEIVEAVLAVREIEREPIGHVGEQGGGGGGRGVGGEGGGGGGGAGAAAPAAQRAPAVAAAPTLAPVASCCDSVSVRSTATLVSTCRRWSGQITVSESIRSVDPSPKCKRGSTEDWNPRVGICSSSCTPPPVPPCLRMTFAPIPAVLAPEPRNTTWR